MGMVDDLTEPTILETLVSEGVNAGPINAMKRLTATITGTTTEARALRKMGIYDEIAKVLVTQRGPEAQRALRLVERAMAGDALNQVQAAIIARAITRPAAMAAYGAMRPEAEPRSEPSAPTAPPQARVQPPATPTRGFQISQAPAAPAAAAQGPQGPQARQMLQRLFPDDSILQAATLQA